MLSFVNCCRSDLSCLCGTVLKSNDRQILEADRLDIKISPNDSRNPQRERRPRDAVLRLYVSVRL